MRKASLILIIMSLASGAASGQILHGMLDPVMDDPSQPFSYFAQPTDVIGALYSPVASEVTPEGYIYTGFGELMFFIGNPPEAINQRLRTLHSGYLPIIQYSIDRFGVRYDFEMFATDLSGKLKGMPLNLVRVTLRNESNEPRTAFVSSAYRFSPHFDTLGPKQFRFLQRFDLMPKALVAGQKEFDPHWKYDLTGEALERSGRVVYFFPSNPEPWQQTIALADNGLGVGRYFTGEITEFDKRDLRLDPYTPMGVVCYRTALRPGESRSLVFKMPIVPLPPDSEQLRAARQADFESEREKTMTFWSKLVAEQPRFRFPETKVQESLLANTVTLLLSIDKVGADYMPTVNKFQYNDYFATDTALMSVALADMGQADGARGSRLYALKARGAANGSYVSAEGHYESFGHVLWSWSRYWTLTRDEDFLRQIYPGVVRGMQWEMEVTSKDSLGLIPPSTMFDDSVLKDCHQAGMDMWALVGIRAAVRLAHAMNRAEDASRFESQFHRLWTAFEKQLSVQTAKTGGYIPPALDRTLKGDDFSNLHTLYPEPLFDPFDPRVTATIRKSQSEYVEGILRFVWPVATSMKGSQYHFSDDPLTHYWHHLDNAENELVRDGAEDQQNAVRDLYSLLVHTSSTHAPQEFGTAAWGTRSYVIPTDMLPDGSASAVLIELLRNMVLRENKNDLHLFSAISPDWALPGNTIEAVNAPSNFGPVTVRLHSTSQGLEVDLANRWRNAPDAVIVHVPWFFSLDSAEVDGRPVAANDNALRVLPDSRAVILRGHIKPNAPTMSYIDSVAAFKHEYRKRWQEFLQTGQSVP